MLKHCDYVDKWMRDMTKMYNVITSSITSVIQDRHKPTIQWQMSLSQRAGGCGMRSPEHYYPATKISAMSIKEDNIKPYFNFDCDAVQLSSDNSDLLRQQPYITRISAYHIAKQQMQDKLQQYVQILNNFTSPQKKYTHNQEELWSHRKLLRLIDNKIQQNYIMSD